MDLIRSSVEANGGLSNIQALSSLIVNGVIVGEDGNELPFKLYKKRPDLVRMQLELPGGTRETGFDGHQAFTVLSHSGVVDQVFELDAEQTDELRVGASMDGLLYQLRSRPEWLEVVAKVEVDGEPAFELKIDDAADSLYDHVWISADHFQEVKLSRRGTSESGADILEEIYFSEFEQVRGVWLAKKTRFERDGILQQTVHIKRVRANVGLFDSLFEMPKTE